MEWGLLATPDFGRSDAWHFSFVTKYLLGQSLHSGQLPVWNSNMGGGFPLIGEGQIGAFYLPNLLLFRLFEPVTAYALITILAILMLGWGMYLWLRLMQYARLPSFVFAATLSVSGMVIAQLPHITLIQGFSLLPWIAAATIWLSQKQTVKRITVWAFLVSQQLLAGFPQASFITVLFVSCYYLWLIKNQSKKLVSVCWYAVAAIFSLGLSAIQLVPSWEFLSQSNAAAGLDPQTASYFSYPLKHLITLAFPFFLGSPRDATYPAFTAFDGSIFWENVGGVGLFPLLLLLFLGFRMKFFLAVAAISFLFMLGKYSPLYIIYSFFPFNLFRVPSRFLWIFIPVILILSSEAWRKLWQAPKHQQFIRTSLIAAALLNTAFLVSLWYPYHAIEPARLWLNAPPSVVVAKESRGVVYSVGTEASHNAIFLSHGWAGGMDRYRFLNHALAPNINALWGVPSTQVYAGRFLRRPSMIDELLTQHVTSNEREATISATGKKLLDLLSVNTIFSALPLTHQGLTEIASWTHDNQTITAWRNPTSLPRAYVATLPTVATTKEQAFAAILNERFIPGQSVIVEQPISLEPPSEDHGRVTILPQTKETELTIRVENNLTRAALVITDTYYPGWIATIDGEKTTVFPVNIRQMGVLLPPGNHDVQVTFVPASLYQGITISGVTLVLLIALMAFPLFSSRLRIGQTTPLPGRHHLRSRDTSHLRKGKAKGRD